MMKLGKLVAIALSTVWFASALSIPYPATAERVWKPPNPSGMNAVKAGIVAPELPTLHSLGFRWPVRGDDDGDASVAVSYRAAGSTKWRAAYPLFWIHPERQPEQYRVAGGRLFAGSVVGLTPSTTYEVQLQLTDPDGGSTDQLITATTRAVPVLPRGMRERYIIPDSAAEPGGGRGSEGDPFRGLKKALGVAKPGDLFILKPGIYRSQGIQIPVSGTEAKPIVIRGESAESVILDGDGADVALDFSRRSDVWLEDVTLRNARVLLRAEAARRIVVRGNIFRMIFLRNATGIEVFKTSASQFLISDNRFLGPNTEWPKKYKGKKTPERIYGITIAGAGHDIAYNKISHVGDGINTGRIIDHNPPGEGLSATDIYNNDIDETRTECIEADHALTNVRVYENQLANCYYGVSSQPSMGGPTYIFRNWIFNTQRGPFKLHNDTSGVLIFHNTSVRSGFPLLIQPGRETVNDVVSRNNVFVGTKGPAIRSTGRMKRCDFDNDGFAYGFSGTFARWNGKTYRSPFEAKQAQKTYGKHGAIKLMGMRGFETGLAPPSGPLVARPRELNRPLLSNASRALDAGVLLSNFNDRFTGNAPDLGCCERGDPLPHVGPRSNWRKER